LILFALFINLFYFIYLILPLYYRVIVSGMCYSKYFWVELYTRAWKKPRFRMVVAYYWLL